MAKRSVTIEGWTLVLRVRVQKKKRKVNGRTRGRYEGKTAHAMVKAPNGERREWYLGSGDRLRQNAGVSPAKGEEKRPGAPKTPATSRGGGKPGRKAGRTDGDTRDLIDGEPDPRQTEFFPRERWTRGSNSTAGYNRRK